MKNLKKDDGFEATADEQQKNQPQSSCITCHHAPFIETSVDDFKSLEDF